MALSAQSNSQGITVRSVTVACLPLVTVLLYLWPKYAALGGGGLRVNPYNLVLMGALAVGAFGLLSKNTRPHPVVMGWMVTFFFALHFGVRFISDAYGFNPGGSVYLDVRELLLLGMLYPIGLMLGHWPGSLGKVSTIVCVCMLVVLVISLFEFVTGNLFSATLITSLPISIDDDFKRSLLFDKTRDGSMRAQGVFLHPIVLGEVAAASFPIALSLFFARKRFWLPILACGACIIVALVSGSRAAQAGLVVAVIGYLGFELLIKRNPKLWVTAFATLPITLTLLAVGYNYVVNLSEGRTTAERLSSQVRQSMWERGWVAFSDAPLIGHGAGSSLQLAGVKGRTGQLTIDDSYLTMLLDYGVLGLITIGGMFLMVILGSISARRTAGERTFHSGYLAAICVIVICQRALSIMEAVAYAMFFSGLLVANQFGKARRSVPPRRGTAQGRNQFRRVIIPVR